MPQHSVVVLAGWLGCQPRFLKLYESLYIRLLQKDSETKCTVLSHISTPTAIVKNVVSDSTAIQSDAEHLLDQIQSLNCKRFFVHAFSNGGCFVWAKIRDTLIQTSNALSDLRWSGESWATFSPVVSLCHVPTEDLANVDQAQSLRLDARRSSVVAPGSISGTSTLRT